MFTVNKQSIDKQLKSLSYEKNLYLLNLFQLLHSVGLNIRLCEKKLQISVDQHRLKKIITNQCNSYIPVSPYSVTPCELVFHLPLAKIGTGMFFYEDKNLDKNL